jgi:hypothetical protein
MTPYPTCPYCHYRIAVGETACYFCEFMGRAEWGDDPAPVTVAAKPKTPRERTERQRETDRLYREAHKAECNARAKLYYQRHKPEVLARIAQKRAEQRGQA